MISVRQAKEFARQWVIESASQVASFSGAFYHGSINYFPDDAALPATSDIDVIIVVDGLASQERLGKLLYRGMMIDASYLPVEQIRSAEQVLGISHLAGSLREDSIIIDPNGQLRKVQVVVASEFTKQGWVIQRCKHAESKIRKNFNALEKTGLFHDRVNCWLFGTGVTTHILLVAGLKNPTVRKRYLDVRELLAEYGRMDFYETLLEMLGCDKMTRRKAEKHLVALSGAFEAAQTAIRTPFTFAADIKELARPVAIDGARELIKRGSPRESVFWMAVTYSRCQKVLYQDGPIEMFKRYDLVYRALLADLGIFSPADLHQRSRLVLQMLPNIWEVAEEIMGANQEILK